MKLNQVIALVTGKKTRATRILTEAHQHWKESLLSGIVRNYEPINEDGEIFPSESRNVQLKVHRILPDISSALVDFYDCVMTQEKANQSAKADIKIDNNLSLAGIPVTVILFLEKQVVDMLTFAKNLPILSTDKNWKFDSNKDCYITESEKTTKTQKKPEVVIKYEATKEHPAQTELFSVDKTIGHWNTIHLSGAIPATKREEIIKRLQRLQDALKIAREEANSQEIQMTKIGDDLMKYIFADKLKSE